MAMVLTGLLLKIAMIATIVVAASVVVERLPHQASRSVRPRESGDPGRMSRQSIQSWIPA